MPSRRTFLKTLGLLGLTACARPAADTSPAAGAETGMSRTITATPTRPPDPATPLPQLPSVTPTHTRCKNDRRGNPFLPLHEVRRGDTSRRVILMTYDDFTIEAADFGKANFEKILAAYRGLKCKTTFFIPGGYEATDTVYQIAPVIERIVAEGHALGCHGLIHSPMTALPDYEIRHHVAIWIDTMEIIVPGYTARWFRAPYGDVNDLVRSIFAEFGMQSVLWSVESNGMVPDTLSKVTGVVKPGDIVLSHAARPYDASLARTILETLLERGFTVESVDTGLAPGDYHFDPCFAA